MDSVGGVKVSIDRLNDSNFHVWKYQIELLLGDKGLTSHITEDASQAKASASSSSDSDSAKWFQNDAKAKAVIGLTLSRDHMEHVTSCKTARSMWTTIMDLFQRKTLLNQLTSRRRFYSAKMGESEKAITFISRVRQLASDCKAMDLSIDDKEIAMTVLCGLPARYEHLIVAIDAASDDKTLSLDFVKSRLLQEEQRMLERVDVKPSTDAALVSVNRGGRASADVPKCTFCGRKYHTESRCWQKHPHLRPEKAGKQAGLTANASPPADDTDSDSGAVVCLMTTTDESAPNNAADRV